MNKQSTGDVQSLFANWFKHTRNPKTTFWTQQIDWENLQFSQHFFELLLADVNEFWNETPELFSEFASFVIADLPSSNDDEPPLAELTFIRFFISGSAIRHAITSGRPSLAYNWILCSISDRAYEDIEPGTPVEVKFWDGRPRSFLVSENRFIGGCSDPIVLKWFADLYYSAWKYSLCHDLAQLMLAESRHVIAAFLTHGDPAMICEAIDAAAHLGSWLNQTYNPEAREIAKVLVSFYERVDLPPNCRKRAATVLSTQIGQHTDQGSAEWARKTLAEFRDTLVQYEECQLLGGSCKTPEEVVENFDEFISVYESFSASLITEHGLDVSACGYRLTQLFDIISPSIAALISIGKCSEAIQLVSAWFGVPPSHRRSSSVLAVVPGHGKGMLYAVDNFSKLYERDTDSALRRMVKAVSAGFDKSIVLRHDRDLPPATTGRRAPQGRNDELADAVSDFYLLDSLQEFLTNAPSEPKACFHIHAELTPFQPLTESKNSIAWPIVTSFEEPQTDRPLKKVLLWSCGTILGAQEIRSIEAYFSANEINCVTVADQEITADEFLAYYRDDSFDAIWVSAHGDYDSREPHKAHIKLSNDGSQSVSVAELLQTTVPDKGRRLLFLNICLGGAALVTAAPARLGMGAMLANRNQAVIAHIAEVGTFVAPLFGTLMAIGLRQSDAFFSAFRFAVWLLPTGHETVLELITSEAPECSEIVERLSRNSPQVDIDDIRTWGTPVFFE